MDQAVQGEVRPEERLVTFESTPDSGLVSGLLTAPSNAHFLFVLGHGAGAGMRHPSMFKIARSLGEVGIAVFRYNFPYMEKGSGPPNSKPVLLGTVRSAVAAARELAPGLPVIAGGKSMGGRMTSMAAAQSPLESVIGLAFYGFPLHPSGKPGIERAEHLFKVTVPMLFLQGTKDTLAEPDLLRPVCEKLGPLATLHEIEGADHSFHAPKSTGMSESQILANLAQTVRNWADALES